jgi:hypothetical protein
MFPQCFRDPAEVPASAPPNFAAICGLFLSARPAEGGKSSLVRT